ncbi:protein ELYS homolog isoform X2 [Teleopsis dalmanni]|uniref:protein ELYS homolog isoform X2 n=1 Tax=Teleopsis dalmanni TaxID=139649 RepID=UPI0018CFC387|nr:protein ELYS homolog isoform X2 [Teleopsis dalmanni]
MDWYEIDVDAENCVKFNENSLPWENHVLNNIGGGVIKNGELAYLANNYKLKIVSLRNGQAVSSYEFLEENGFGHYCIRHICEILCEKLGTILAICLHNVRTFKDSVVAIYSVEQNRIFESFALEFNISIIYYISPPVSKKSLLQRFDGCLAIGSASGTLVLIDLNLSKTMSSHQLECEDHNLKKDCRFVNYTQPFEESLRQFDECRAKQVHFGIQMEVLELSSCVTSILPINISMSLAVGYADGKLVIYDMIDLEIYHVALPHPMQNKSPLVKMDYLEPPDDPRSCLYIWTMHESPHHLTASLHTLTYQTRLTDKDGHNNYKDFISGSICLQLPLEPTKSHALSCQSIYKFRDENDSFCLSVLTWYSDIEEKIKLVVFDLNQWYKEEMPITVNQRNYKTYLAGFILSGIDCVLYSFVSPNSIAPFNSIQRIENHFFPNSLSFDCVLLLPNCYQSYRWEGIQNKVINLLRCSNSSIFLEQDLYYNEILRTGLLPQFFELNTNKLDLRKEKYYAILSVALENNCVNLLRDCVKSWSDGSFMGSVTEVTGLSVTLMTQWIMSRATSIKKRCNDLCNGVFDYVGYSLDSKGQKELGFLSRQLKLLADLVNLIISLSKQKLLTKDLKEKHVHLQAAAEYHEVLLWLFNIGLLSEVSPKMSQSDQLVSYPYSTLKDIYSRKRIRFANINDSFVSKKTGSCRLLFIDAFIDHECKGNMLREHWLENNGNGLYPPTSIEYMLRLLLIPEIDFDKKCAILLYFLLDLNIAVDDAYKNVVNFIKFPSVFKMSASLIKTVETFWHLDHDQYLLAVNEFISPFNNNNDYPHWIVELLIEALLAQKQEYLALRVIGSYPTFVPPILKLKTFLLNDLLSEAFHFARSKNDVTLLEYFFTYCLRSGKYSVIREFVLSEREGQLIQNLLKRNNTDYSESLNFVYLLQKSKYIDAVSYLDDLAKSKYNHTKLVASYFDTPNLVSTFNITMTPVTQDLTDVFFRIRNKIKKKETDNNSPVPFSCQLIRQNANDLLGGIYHSSALSAHFATCYFDEVNVAIKRDPKIILNPNDAPFLRKPQFFNLHHSMPLKSNTISYPQIYKQSGKRSLAESELKDANEDYCITVRSEHNPKKKRRLIGQELIHEFSQFKEKTVDNNYQNTPTLISYDENPNNFFIKPITSFKQGIVKSGNKCSELHSILKTRVNDVTKFSKKFLEEEKNIRFQLSSFDNKIDVENENKNGIDNSFGPFENNISKKQILSKDYKKFSSNLSLQEKIDMKNLKKTVIHDSEIEYTTEEDFFLPLSVQNTSVNLTKLDSSVFEKDTLALISEKGPKPRKHIIRSNIESSNLLLTEKICNEIKIQPNKEKMNLKNILTEKVQSLKQEAENSYLVTCNNNDLACFSNSKINEFVPKISSSKVCDTQLQFSQEQCQSKRNFLDCTTIVESLTPMESADVIVDAFKNTQEIDKNNKLLNKYKESANDYKMLDTTLDMSVYDFTLTQPTVEVVNVRNIESGIQEETKADHNNMKLLSHIDYDQNTKSSGIYHNKIYSNEDIIELVSSNDNSRSNNDDCFQSSSSDKNNIYHNLNNSNSESESSGAELYEDINTISDSSDIDEVEIIDAKCTPIENILETEKDYVKQSSNHQQTDVVQFCDTLDPIKLCKPHNTDNLSTQNDHVINLDKLSDQGQHPIEYTNNLDTNVKLMKSKSKELLRNRNKNSENDVKAKTNGAANDFKKDIKEFKSATNLKNKYDKMLTSNTCFTELKTAVSLPLITNSELNLDNPPLSEYNKNILKQSKKAAENEDEALISEVNENTQNFVLGISEDEVIDYTNILENSQYNKMKSNVDTVISNDTNESTKILNEKHHNLLMQQKDDDVDYAEKLKSTFKYNNKGLLKDNYNSTIGRNKRGISLPLQHNFNENEETNYTICTRKIRASSLQPKSPNELKITRSRRHSRSTSISVDEDEKNRSPTLMRTQNRSLRRRSVTLESIVEINPLIDSPSTNTRSRTRYSSIDSELNNIEQTSLKRRRTSSVASHKSDQTPKHTRRSGISSQTEVHTPKSTGQQAISKPKIICDDDPDNSQPNDKKKNVKNQHSEVSHKKSNSSAESSKILSNTDISQTTCEYTNARRLTRAQLSILEKSSATATDVSFAVTTRRVSKRASSHNSVNTNNSDNADSVSSHIDNLSKIDVPRRITRSSAKDKDEVDDELVSNASSNSSNKRLKQRSKEKISPNIKLNTIPEN